MVSLKGIFSWAHENGEDNEAYPHVLSAECQAIAGFRDYLLSINRQTQTTLLPLRLHYEINI